MSWGELFVLERDMRRGHYGELCSIIKEKMGAAGVGVYRNKVVSID